MPQGLTSHYYAMVEAIALRNVLRSDSDHAADIAATEAWFEDRDCGLSPAWRVIYAAIVEGERHA